MDLSKYSLMYNAAAHFASLEKYPEGDLASRVAENTIQGFEALCYALELLSVHGELARRHMGHDRGETLKAAELAAALMPRDIAEAKVAVLEAVYKGMRVDEDETEEVDEVLAELQKKTGNP